jgi:hypothetical protein
MRSAATNVIVVMQVSFLDFHFNSSACGRGAEGPVQSNHCEAKGRRVRLCEKVYAQNGSCQGKSPRGMEPNQLYFERGPDGHFFRLWYRDSGRNQLVQQRLNNYTFPMKKDVKEKNFSPPL